MKANDLLYALKLAQLAQPKGAKATPDNEDYCLIHNGFVALFSGKVSVRVPFDDGLVVGARCGQRAFTANTKQLIAALTKVKHDEYFAIIYIDSKHLSVKTDAMEALISSLPLDLFTMPDNPDENDLSVNDSLRTALLKVLPAIDEKHPKHCMTGALLQTGSVIGASDGVFIEAEHGLDLPLPRLTLQNAIVPKNVVKLISKVKSPLVGLGHSSNTLTFWFADETYICARLIDAKYPDHTRVYLHNLGHDKAPVPKGFFEAVKLLSVAKKGKLEPVHFNPGCIESTIKGGGKCKIAGLPSGIAFNAEYLKMIEPMAQQVDFGTKENCALFFTGDRVKGVVMGLRR